MNKAQIFIVVSYSLFLFLIFYTQFYVEHANCFSPVSIQIEKDIKAGYNYVAVADKGNHVLSFWVNNKRQWKIYDTDDKRNGCVITGNNWTFL